MIAGRHRRELSVSRGSFRMKHVYPQLLLHELSAGQRDEVLKFPQYIISTANISHCKHHLHPTTLEMEKIGHL